MPITLSSRFARRAALVGAAATLSLALGACSASFDAPTLQPYQAAEGTSVDSGQIKLRNLLVLADAAGKGELHGVIVNDGTEPDTLVGIAQAPAGTQDGQDGSWQAGQVTFTGLKAPVALQPGTALLLAGTTAAEASATGTATPATPATPGTSATPGKSATPGTSATPAGPTETPTAPTPGAEDSGPAIVVTGAKPGQMVNVTITFGTAAPVSAYVPVLTDDHYSPTPPPAGQ
ncbi:hypothetical protein JOF29_005936 [Kribbella aluminosa]|uniref:Copper(I)-binding protein n=1 Tax=Kribbella aluminosa TaxID=416017 RepID=A0ABS4UT88_9ACTN|nr:hypothetical protein [Kribbella aluminosa]MBP2354826.1 hypothetical protein [Kribbella aluminosa]